MQPHLPCRQAFAGPLIGHTQLGAGRALTSSPRRWNLRPQVVVGTRNCEPNWLWRISSRDRRLMSSVPSPLTRRPTYQDDKIAIAPGRWAPKWLVLLLVCVGQFMVVL